MTSRPPVLPRGLPRRRPGAGVRLTGDRRKGLAVDVAFDMSVSAAMSATSTLSDLSQFVTLAGKPKITVAGGYGGAGNLGGEGVVRHQAEAQTDSHAVEVTIGYVGPGKTRLVLCADPDFNKYYGLEIETGLVNNKFHIIKGRGTDALLDGYVFSEVDKYSTTTVYSVVGDKVRVWYDRANNTLRGYKNGTQVVSLPVDPREIAHGIGNRFHGVAVGVDLFLGLNPGALPTDYKAWDV